MDDPEQIALIEVTRRHSGPLPDPGTLAGYGAVDRSFPERIMRMAEADQAARISDRAKVVAAETGALGAGMRTVLILGVLGLIAGTLLIALGFPAGAGAFALPLLSVVPKVIAAFRGSRPE